tara:strand:+ start:127 stop:1197 length:1071 start_codon:yes stop_codon:yes gene_type:complete
MPKKYINVLGVMSGTSLDGLDFCLVKFDLENISNFKILKTHTYEYDETWKNYLRNAVKFNNKEIKKINIEFALLVSKYVDQFKLDFSRPKIELISSHGHTIFHEPERGLTLQIGDGNIISQKTRTKVVYDFRSQDVNLGGQGAPLVPIGDLNLFRNYKFCLNLGGFANISIKTKEDIQAFDICPVNTVLNHYSKKMNHEFDRNGFLSKSGKTDKILLNELNNINYYQKSGPKSLGIEFVNELIFPLIEKKDLKPNDILMTFIDHISFQINESIKKYPLSKILITGGGAFNKNLVEKIKSKIKHEVIIPKKEIINFKEALIFAYLGILRLNNQINCLKSVTGAEKNHSSGKIIDYNS